MRVVGTLVLGLLAVQVNSFAVPASYDDCYGDEVPKCIVGNDGCHLSTICDPEERQTITPGWDMRRAMFYYCPAEKELTTVIFCGKEVCEFEGDDFDTCNKVYVPHYCGDADNDPDRDSDPLTADEAHDPDAWTKATKEDSHSDHIQLGGSEHFVCYYDTDVDLRRASRKRWGRLGNALEAQDEMAANIFWAGVPDSNNPVDRGGLTGGTFHVGSGAAGLPNPSLPKAIRDRVEGLEVSNWKFPKETDGPTIVGDGTGRFDQEYWDENRDVSYDSESIASWDEAPFDPKMTIAWTVSGVTLGDDNGKYGVVVYCASGSNEDEQGEDGMVGVLNLPCPDARESPSPTQAPTKRPTRSPVTSPPSVSPTKSPTRSPTRAPTDFPTRSPTKSPTRSPVTRPPTPAPTRAPVRPCYPTPQGDDPHSCRICDDVEHAEHELEYLSPGWNLDCVDITYYPTGELATGNEDCSMTFRIECVGDHPCGDADGDGKPNGASPDAAQIENWFNYHTDHANMGGSETIMCRVDNDGDGEYDWWAGVPPDDCVNDEKGDEPFYAGVGAYPDLTKDFDDWTDIQVTGILPWADGSNAIEWTVTGVCQTPNWGIASDEKMADIKANRGVHVNCMAGSFEDNTGEDILAEFCDAPCSHPAPPDDPPACECVDQCEAAQLGSTLDEDGRVCKTIEDQGDGDSILWPGWDLRWVKICYDESDESLELSVACGQPSPADQFVETLPDNIIGGIEYVVCGDADAALNTDADNLELYSHADLENFASAEKLYCMFDSSPTDGFEWSTGVRTLSTDFKVQQGEAYYGDEIEGVSVEKNIQQGALLEDNMASVRWTVANVDKTPNWDVFAFEQIRCITGSNFDESGEDDLHGDISFCYGVCWDTCLEDCESYENTITDNDAVDPKALAAGWDMQSVTIDINPIKSEMTIRINCAGPCGDADDDGDPDVDRANADDEDPDVSASGWTTDYPMLGDTEFITCTFDNNNDGNDDWFSGVPNSENAIDNGVGTFHVGEAPACSENGHTIGGTNVTNIAWPSAGQPYIEWTVTGIKNTPRWYDSRVGTNDGLSFFCVSGSLTDESAEDHLAGRLSCSKSKIVVEDDCEEREAECSRGCPSSWLGDGVCDITCTGPDVPSCHNDHADCDADFAYDRCSGATPPATDDPIDDVPEPTVEPVDCGNLKRNACLREEWCQWVPNRNKQPGDAAKICRTKFGYLEGLSG